MPHPGKHSRPAGCGSGQPGLVVGDPAHSRGLKLHDHYSSFQPRPFYDSMIVFQELDAFCEQQFPTPPCNHQNTFAEEMQQVG